MSVASRPGDGGLRRTLDGAARTVDDLADARHGVALVGLALIGSFLLYLAWSMQHESYDIWGGLLLLPLLTAVTLPIVWRVTRDDAAPMHGLLSLAVVAKLLAAVPRYFVAFTVYGGNADADTYHDAGRLISDEFRAGRLWISDIVPRTQGTGFIKELTGFVYAIVGPTRLGGFVVFSWLGFWGLFLMYRAALIALPEIDHRRYALLLFFLPSLLFWPSSLGKEAWLVLGLGVAFYGAARLLAGRPGGLVVAGVGCVLSGYVRPHVAVLVVAGLGVAYLVRRSEDRTSAVEPLRKLIVVGVLALGLAIGLSQTSRFLGDPEGGTSLSAILDRATAQSSGEAGSTFEVTRPNSPLEFPMAFVSVMFRPSLLDVRNANQLIAALETTLVAVLFLGSWRRVLAAIPWAFRRPYLMLCLVYSALFGFAWSSIGNYGILVRQRVLAWPFLVILLALPAVKPAARPAEAPAGPAPVPARW